VDGYEPPSYGEAMADVYDEWYAELGDVAATVATLTRLAAGGPVLELGVGTGRLAIPVAEAGLDVSGVDVSPAMLARLRAKPGGQLVAASVGDMARDEDLPSGPFAVVVVAFNTFFSLTSADDQARCFAAVAARLAPGGTFVLEGFVPDDELIEAGSRVEVRSLSAHRVVLTVSRHDAAAQRSEGQFVELTEEGGVRLRPWSLRYAPPDELDAMAAAVGLVLAERWASWDGAPFTDDSTHHVSRYVSRPTAGSSRPPPRMGGQ
jgi:SAM-dependent methyltransferase